MIENNVIYVFSKVIIPIMTAVISVGVSTLISVYLDKKKDVNNLLDKLNSILSIAVQYPYLESKNFAEKWSPEQTESDERYLRYEQYVILVFNYLEEVCKFFRFKKKKIEKFIGIKEWVRIHGKYWSSPTEAYANSDTYDEKFKAIVKSYLQ
ncbi:MAG: hypothetical protein K2I95_07055 [Treponemataceae bacterium]|nr:hypothetical protein [Treponemataceae bacterium]